MKTIPFSIFALVNDKSKITGIILAGGKSSRMGMDKGFCAFKGKPMVQYAIDVLDQVCDTIIISSNNADYELFNFPVIPDIIKDIGPLGGIYSGLKHSKTYHNFFISCDMPMITVDLVQHILSSKENYDAVIPTWNNFPEPMCAYYNKNITKNLVTFIQKENYKLQDVIQNINHKTVEITHDLNFYNDQLFTNVNCGVDLNRLNNSDI